MSKKLQKSFNEYLTKLKINTPRVHISTKAITASTKRILSGCKHPKTPSFAVDQKTSQVPEGRAATLSDIDRFLIENFSSLYCNDNNVEEDDDKKKKKEEDDDDQKLNVFLFESPRFIDPVPEIRASNRFFVSPATSSSLVEEARSSAASTSEEVQSCTTATSFKDSIRSSAEIKGIPLPDESVAVLTYSPNPYSDFRRSMEEMVEVRLNQNQPIDWDYMEELLFCYLKLNEKKSYKYILGAFVDITAGLRQNNDETPARHRRTKGERRRRRRRDDGG